jgi:hypothetical protein
MVPKSKIFYLSLMFADKLRDISTLHNNYALFSSTDYFLCSSQLQETPAAGDLQKGTLDNVLIALVEMKDLDIVYVVLVAWYVLLLYAAQLSSVECYLFPCVSNE